MFAYILFCMCIYVKYAKEKTQSSIKTVELDTEDKKFGRDFF